MVARGPSALLASPEAKDLRAHALRDAKVVALRARFPGNEAVTRLPAPPHLLDNEEGVEVAPAWIKLFLGSELSLEPLANHCERGGLVLVQNAIDRALRAAEPYF